MPGRIFPTPESDKLQPISGSGTSTTPVTLYKHTFTTAAISPPVTTYSVTPDILNTSLTTTGWVSSAGNFTSYTGASGNALSLSTASATTTNYTLSLSVGAGKTFTATSFSFWNKTFASGSNTGYTNWSLSIGGIAVGSGSLSTAGASTGTLTVSNPVTNLTGTIAVVLTLSGGSHYSSATFRLDDFTLNGYMQLLPGALSVTLGKDGKYAYGFNGKRMDNEVAGDGNQYDYGLRIYNPQIGKFLSVDPLFKGYPWNSTYSYAEGDVIRSVDLDGGEKKIVTTTYWKNSSGVWLSIVTSADVNDPYKLGKGVLNITKYDKKYFDSKGSHGDVITIVNYEPQTVLSKIGDFFTGQRIGGDNKFGFVYTSKPQGGSTLGIGNANVQFGETLDIDILIKTIGLIRDVAPEKSTITEWMSEKVKFYYNTVKASMKIGDQLSSDADKLFPDHASEIPGTTPEASSTTTTNTKKPVVDQTVPMGPGKWDYYDKKMGTSGYKSGERDSIVPGKGNAPDTNFHRTYSQPAPPKRDIPKQN